MCSPCTFSTLLFVRPSPDHYTFHASAIVLFHLTVRFLLISSAVQYVKHPGQNWNYLSKVWLDDPTAFISQLKLKFSKQSIY